ncbi:MAG: SIR2 family protein [Proteobacteria bacterium]|nr:SIR2 family protein [Pseudomonadota bacterium]
MTEMEAMQGIADLVKKECCIFIGAGIPKTLGFPLWSELVQDLIDYVWSKRKIFVKGELTYSIKQALEDSVRKGKLISAITYCRDRFKSVDQEEDYQKKIVSCLHDEVKYSHVKDADVYIEISKLLNKAAVLQTNLDRSLEKCLSTPTHTNMNLPNPVSVPCLIYLHGIVTDPQSWIITRDEYDNYYQRNPRFVDFIQEVFQRFDVLFIGYSLSDKEILDQIAKVKGSGRQYIFVMEESERNKADNDVVENDLKHYGITVVRYSIENEGFDEFLHFLKKINSLIEPPARVALPGQDGSTLDG